MEGMNRTRFTVFLAGCAFLILWVFPQVEVTYSGWSNRESRWVPFKTIQTRPFLTNVDFGEVQTVDLRNDEALVNMIRSRTAWIVSDGGGVRRRTGINWATQALQSLITAGVFAGVIWSYKPK